LTAPAYSERHATVAMLRIIAIAAMLLDPAEPVGEPGDQDPEPATVTETTDTSAFNCESLSIQSLFRYGNMETVICRSI
jgi:hypothetical protein